MSTIKGKTQEINDHERKGTERKEGTDQVHCIMHE